MAQVIPQLGAFAKVGGGLAQGLEDYASRKLNQLQQQESRSELSNLLQKTGRYSKADADVISRLPDKDQLNAYLNLPQSGQGQESPLDVLQSEQGKPNRTIIEPEQNINVQAEPQPQQNQQIDLSKLSGRELLQQAQAAGLGLNPQMMEQAVQKFEQLKQNPEKLAQFQNELQQYANGQGQQQGNIPQNLQKPQSPLLQPQAPWGKKKQLSPYEEQRLAQGQEKIDLQRQEAEAKAYERVKPYLEAQAADFRNSKEMYKVANRMLNNIKEHRKDWPVASGYLPVQAHRDVNVRKYAADGEKLVGLSANAAKGQPTNFKIKLEQLKKASLDQPIDTQIGILEDIIKDTKEVFNTQDIINEIGEQKAGRYPIDIALKIIQRVGRPDVNEQRLTPGTDASVLNPNQIPKGTRLQKGGKYYIWNGTEAIPE